MLPPGPRGHVDSGLGKCVPLAVPTLIPPTEDITHTGQELVVDGVRIVFQLTPETEAPAEMNFFFPDFGWLCTAENCTHTMHNLVPIRGAQVRNALAWSKYINEAIELFGDKAVEQRMNAFGEFGEPLQHIINAYAYGDVWSRPGLSLSVKSLAMIAMMAAANRPAELRVHLSGAEVQFLHFRLLDRIEHDAFDLILRVAPVVFIPGDGDPRIRLPFGQHKWSVAD